MLVPRSRLRKNDSRGAASTDGEGDGVLLRSGILRAKSDAVRSGGLEAMSVDCGSRIFRKAGVMTLAGNNE